MQIEMRSEMPSVVQGPLPRNTLSDARLRTSSGSRLGRRNPASRRLFRVRGLSRGTNARSPSTCPVAMGSHASLDQDDACRLLQPSDDARAHPASVSILTREWSSRSATRRHQWMPVALAHGCVAASRAGEPHAAHDGLRASRSTCVDKADCEPRSPEQR